MPTRKMFLMMLLCGAQCGLSFRSGERDVHATPAPPPNPCPSGCKAVYAWWTDGNPGGTECVAVEQAGTTTATVSPTTHTTHALILYNVVPGGNLKSTDDPIERFIYADKSETCGQVDGAWQSPQEVAPSGKGTWNVSIRRQVCK